VVRAENLIDSARARAGLDDFGEDSWREGFAILVRSLEEDAALNNLGQEIIGGQLIAYLANRLDVERWYRLHPEIDRQEIVAPLFGLGLPRTGSTALSFLVAMDPRRRFLRTWEAGQPCPPPETATEHTDARIAETQAGLDVQMQMFPDFIGMLPTSATGPQECLLLMGLGFRSQVFEGMARIPSYSEWLQSCEMEPAYQYHRRVLKLLQWRCPPTRWWLKTPSHMLSIEALDRVYPAARFVMTHRDVAAVLPSVAAVMATLSGSLTDRPDPLYLGTHNTVTWHTALQRLVAFRDRGNEGRFFDIQFGEMQSEPLGAMRRLYEWLGEDLSPDVEKRMTAWWDENARERHGSHRYRAETYGIDFDRVRQQFRFYTDRFEVPLDDASV
jgi:hypothetical protein